MKTLFAFLLVVLTLSSYADTLSAPSQAAGLSFSVGPLHSALLTFWSLVAQSAPAKEPPAV